MPVQAVSIHTTVAGDDGINFSNGIGSFWVVGPNVVVAADLADGVESAAVVATLINHGSIVSSSFQDAGVRFVNSGTISNEAGALITGSTAIHAEHSNISIVNFGSIVASSYGVAFFDDTTNTALDNRSSIFSNFCGVYDGSNAHGATINNSGTIEGLGQGILLETGIGRTTHIVNSGLIKGGTHSVLGGIASALDLQNSGK